MILDFLEDDAFFSKDETRQKSKTEFVKRERQESEDSNQEEFQLPGDAQDYLNSILPNNFIKFKKHSESVSPNFHVLKYFYRDSPSLTRREFDQVRSCFLGKPINFSLI